MNIKISDTAHKIISEHDIIKEDIRLLKEEINQIHYKLHNTQGNISDINLRLIKLIQKLKSKEDILVTWLAVLTGVSIGLLITVLL